MNILKKAFAIVSYQFLTMIFSSLIGIIIVRSLSKEDYGLFSFMNILISSAMGLSTFVSLSNFIPFANNFGLEKNKLVESCKVFFKLNLPYVIIALIFILFSAVYAAYDNNWIEPKFFLLLFCAFLIFKNQYKVTFFHNFFKVGNKAVVIFKINLFTEIIRLVLILSLFYLLTTFIAGFEIFLVLTVTLITSSIAFILNRKASGFRLKLRHPFDQSQRRYFNKLLRPIVFPSYLFHVLNYLKPLIIVFIAQSTVFAETVALGRLMAIFVLIDKVVEMLIIPKLSLIHDKFEYLKKLLLGTLFFVVIGVFLAISAFLFPSVWLWLLGANYENLEIALIWAISAAILERISGLYVFAQLSRARASFQWIVPIISFSVYFLFIYIYGLETAELATMALMVYATVTLSLQILIFSYLFINEKTIANE